MCFCLTVFLFSHSVHQPFTYFITKQDAPKKQRKTEKTLGANDTQIQTYGGKWVHISACVSLNRVRHLHFPPLNKLSVHMITQTDITTIPPFLREDDDVAFCIATRQQSLYVPPQWGEDKWQQASDKWAKCYWVKALLIQKLLLNIYICVCVCFPFLPSSLPFFPPGHFLRSNSFRNLLLDFITLLGWLLQCLAALPLISTKWVMPLILCLL